MNIMNRAMLPAFATLLLAGCNDSDTADSSGQSAEKPADIAVTAPEVSFTPGEKTNGNSTVKLGGPVKIGYRIIGEPIVGQPVAIDLRLTSTMGAQAFDVSYRINDSTALKLAEAQPERITIAPSAGEEFASQQVTVIPMREGRLYLNVAAQVQSDFGSVSSVTAVPIQVGQAPRELLENGTVTTDENGELIRNLPAEEGN